MTGAAALLAVKSFARAKSRLAAALSRDARAALARSLADRALDAARACRALDGVTVLTDGDDVEAWGRARGAAILRDPPGARDLGAAIDGALAILGGRGAVRALVLMTDLPSIEPHELAALIGRLDAADLVAAPDADDEGTNALALRLPPPTPTCFGRRGSFALHLDAARRAGLRTAVARSPGLAFDLDEPDQLAAGRPLKRKRASRVSWT